MKLQATDGFTLLEMVIVVTIGALILATLGALVVAQINLYHTQTVATDLEDSMNRALNATQQLVAGGKTIVASRVFGGTTYTTGNDTLIIELPSIRQNGDIIQGQSDFAVFYLDGTNFYLEIEASAQSARKTTKKRLVEFVYHLIFRYNTSNAINARLATLDLSLRRQVGENIETAEGTSTILLRNKSSHLQRIPANLLLGKTSRLFTQEKVGEVNSLLI